MDVSCPLCKSRELSILEEINVEDLKHLYEKNLSLDISDELDGYKTIEFYKCLNCDLQFFYPLITGSESLYEKLMKFDWYYVADKEEYKISKKFIKTSDTLLEIGCGNGLFAQKINTRYYIGLELNTSAKKNALKQGIRVLNQTIGTHSLNHKNIYSIVCAFQVLEHVNDPYNFLKESIECLKEGGFLIISVPSDDSFVRYGTENPLNLPPHHVTRWSDLALINIAKLFDMELVHLEHEPLADIHIRWYAQVFFQQKAKKIFPGQKESVFDSFWTQILLKIEFVFVILYSFFLKHFFRRPRGHSVIVIFRKSINTRNKN